MNPGENVILFVAPLAGAWIEIRVYRLALKKSEVAPLAGAWIEIPISWEIYSVFPVAPLAGAWIEIFRKEKKMNIDKSRSPRGSVD